MKIEINQGSRYVTLTTEAPTDLYLIGKISARLEIGTFFSDQQRSIDIPIEKVVQALAGEK